MSFLDSDLGRRNVAVIALTGFVLGTRGLSALVASRVEPRRAVLLGVDAPRWRWGT
jgi:hypothetical protein